MKPLASDHPFLLVRIRKYQGRPIVLSHGQALIAKGDRILELHFNNELLVRMVAKARTEMQLAVVMIRAMEEMLPRIALYLENRSKLQEIKGVYGISMIYRGAEQLGFHVMDMKKGLVSLLTRLYLRFLLSVLHPEGTKRYSTKANLMVPKIIVMSTDELVSRYPPLRKGG